MLAGMARMAKIVTEISDQVLQVSMPGTSVLRIFTAIAFERESQKLCAELGATNCFLWHPLDPLDPNLSPTGQIKYHQTSITSRLNLSFIG